ncbi:hypothetical protein TNCT_242731, partial [Trichonephila clavata]
FVQISEE